jgi:hypothetical protein
MKCVRIYINMPPAFNVSVLNVCLIRFIASCLGLKMERPWMQPVRKCNSCVCVCVCVCVCLCVCDWAAARDRKERGTEDV